MKNLAPLRIAQILVAIFFITIFYSCGMDKNAAAKGKEAVDNVIDDIKKAVPTSADIGSVDVAFCEENVDDRHGCTCKFKETGGGTSTVFVSNMDQSKNACLTINGKTEILTGKRTDSRGAHFKHSYIPDWIVLDPNAPVHIFNEDVEDDYEANKKMIIETMLVMHEIPEKIKLRKNKGKDGEEVPQALSEKYEKLWAEAYKTATEERAKGNHGEPLKIELSNDTYDVSVVGNVGDHHDDGSDDYAGTIEIKSKAGKVIGTKDFEGVCMCVD